MNAKSSKIILGIGVVSIFVVAAIVLLKKKKLSVSAPVVKSTNTTYSQIDNFIKSHNNSLNDGYMLGAYQAANLYLQRAGITTLPKDNKSLFYLAYQHGLPLNQIINNNVSPYATA